jgi:hypothetical protein
MSVRPSPTYVECINCPERIENDIVHMKRAGWGLLFAEGIDSEREQEAAGVMCPSCIAAITTAKPN